MFPLGPFVLDGFGLNYSFVDLVFCTHTAYRVGSILRKRGFKVGKICKRADRYNFIRNVPCEKMFEERQASRGANIFMFTFGPNGVRMSQKPGIELNCKSMLCRTHGLFINQ